MEHAYLFIGLAAIGAFFMAFNNGANDVANAFASAVGSKAITMRMALFLAATVVFAGAIFLGGQVATKLVEGVVRPSEFDSGETYMVAMLAVLFSAGIFVLLSTLTGLPVSSSNAIVGAVTGVALVVAGPGAVNWAVYATIVTAWIASPFIAGFLAYLLFSAIRHGIIGRGGPGTLRRVAKWLPMWIALTLGGCVFGVLYWITADGDLALELWHLAVICFLLAIPSYFIIRKIISGWLATQTDDADGAENAFKNLQVFTSSYVAFGIGSNDVANSISPVFAIYVVASRGGIPESFTDVGGMPFWILALGGIGMAVGIAALGGRVMKTLGENITRLTNTRGFSVDFSVATTVIAASWAGIPVSTTQAATGAIVGVGFSKNQAEIDSGHGINWKKIMEIVAAWVVTPLISGIITVGLFYLLRMVL